MAKGARASAVKKNKSKLKKKVFGPVEMARNERLSAKLLELAGQSKPPREEMEVEQVEDNKTTGHDTKTGGMASDVFSIPIPATMHTAQQFPTPPNTPPLQAASPQFECSGMIVQKQMADEALFYQLLGASEDIVGFDASGYLQLRLWRDTDMDVDDAHAAPSKKRRQPGASSDRKDQPGRIQKSRHRRARNEIAFKKHPMKKAKKEKARKG